MTIDNNNIFSCEQHFSFRGLSNCFSRLYGFPPSTTKRNLPPRWNKGPINARWQYTAIQGRKSRMVCPTEGRGSSKVGRKHILNESLDKTSSPAPAQEGKCHGIITHQKRSEPQPLCLEQGQGTVLTHTFRNASKEKEKRQFADCTSEAFAATEKKKKKKGHYEFFCVLFPVKRKGSIELQSTLCYTLQEAQPTLKLI